MVGKLPTLVEDDGRGHVSWNVRILPFAGPGRSGLMVAGTF